MRRTTLVLIAALTAGTAALWNPSFQATPPELTQAMQHAQTAADRGIVTFAFGDWDALSTDTLRVSASPWKLTNAALALQQADGNAEDAAAADIGQIYRQFGFNVPDTFANWPDGMPQPAITTPVGLNVGTGSALLPPISATISNIGCAACHSSVVYDAQGQPDLTQVWLGTPNGSINLEAYTQTLFTAVRDYGQDADVLMDTTLALYPDTTLREQITLRRFILPELQNTITERDAEFGRLLPFRASLAGATNGLDSLQNRLNLLPEGEVLTESIFNSVPDLGGRLWRTKLLNSGTYALPGIDHTDTLTATDITPEHRAGHAGIIAYFTVPAMGVTQEVAQSNISDALDITAWMEVYAPQPYPGTIDASLAAMGGAIYARDCASCHGTYDGSQLTSFPNVEADIGTDPQRARLLTQTIADAVNGGTFGRYITARTVTTYTAPPLTGVWSSGPYLHNGAVPTVWHLLTPDERPETFEVGGHRQDLSRLGVDLAPPADYVQWSTPARVDTAAFGLSNGGHTFGQSLSDAEKWALIEFLKTL